MKSYQRFSEKIKSITINYDLLKFHQNIIIIMDYKSFKHLKLALKINYNFAKSTIIIKI